MAGNDSTSTIPAARWWRGNLHMHTFWSDGRAFPEEAVAWYKSHGYHFLGVSDHNVFQDNPDRWVSEQNRERYFAEYLAAYPDAPVRIGASGAREARLSTFNEFAPRFDEPGRFLLIPTAEATRTVQFSTGPRNEVHMNYAGVPALLPSIAAPDFARIERDVPLAEFIERHAAETAALARSLGRRHVFMLNPDSDHVFSRTDEFRNVKGKGRVAIGMASQIVICFISCFIFPPC